MTVILSWFIMCVDFYQITSVMYLCRKRQDLFKKVNTVNFMQRLPFSVSSTPALLHSYYSQTKCNGRMAEAIFLSNPFSANKRCYFPYWYSKKLCKNGNTYLIEWVVKIFSIGISGTFQLNFSSCSFFVVGNLCTIINHAVA